MVAPAAYLRWFTGLLQTNNTTRMFGVALLLLGGAMAWAGTTEESALASFLTIGGVAGLAVGTALVIVPGLFRKFASAFLPAVEEARLPAWRALGIVVTSAGLLLIYVGVVAL